MGKRRYELKCLNCGKTFYGQKKHSKFCSRKCVGAYTIRTFGQPMRRPDVRQKVARAERGKHISEETRRKISIARKGKPLTSKQKSQLARLHALLRKTGGGKARWCNLPESEARKLFEDYQQSRVNGRTWAQSKEGDFEAIKKLFLKYFPHEYEDFVELKMDRKTSAYAIGRQFEYRVKKYFKEKGYWVLRSPHSAGPADLVALKKGEVLLIQCKVSKQYPQKERNTLQTLATSIGAQAFFVYRGRAPKFKLIFEYIPNKEA